MEGDSGFKIEGDNTLMASPRNASSGSTMSSACTIKTHRVIELWIGFLMFAHVENVWWIGFCMYYMREQLVDWCSRENTWWIGFLMWFSHVLHKETNPPAVLYM